MQEFLKKAWKSNELRYTWEPIFNRLASLWNSFETISVAAGIRKASLSYVHEKDWKSFTKRMLALGLVTMPLRETALINGYAATNTTTNNEAFIAIVSKPEYIGEAYEELSNYSSGHILGYPKCCQEFFLKHWVNESKKSLEIYMDTSTSKYPNNNIILRYLGIRAVPHLPCSFGCKESYKLSTDILDAAIDYGYRTDVDRLKEILSWPMEYSVLHGISVITTPVIKLSYNADYTPTKYEVKLDGTFRNLVEFSDTYYRDNGFASLRVQTLSHAPIIEAVLDTKATSICDLGCGNGMLLQEINKQRSIQAFGCDTNKAAIGRSRTVFPDSVLKVESLYLYNIPQVDLVILMPGRLTEVSDKEAETLHSQLKGKHILCYAYGDWITKFGGIVNLCTSAGLKPSGKIYKNKYTEATIVQN